MFSTSVYILESGPVFSSVVHSIMLLEVVQIIMHGENLKCQTF